MFFIWYSMRMIISKLYQLLSNVVRNPVLIGLQIRSRQEASSFSSIQTLNLVYLCKVHLETWSNFDIVTTIQLLQVLYATTRIVISLWETCIYPFLDFWNDDNTFVTFYITTSCAFLLLTSWKPNKFVACFIFYVLSIHIGFEPM